MKILINGKEHGLHWGMPCLAEMCEMLDCTIEDAGAYILGDSKYNIFQLRKASVTAVYCAMRHYAKLNRLDLPDVTIYEVEDYIDTTPAEQFGAVRADFLNSMLNGKSIAETLGIAVSNTEIKQKKSPSASTKKSSSYMKSATSHGK